MAKESSFFEKLKRGMGTEIPQEEFVEKEEEIEEAEVKVEVEKEEEREKKEKEKEKLEEEPKNKSASRRTVNQRTTKIRKLEMKTTPVEKKKKEVLIKKLIPKKAPETRKGWFEPEGKLSVDVYQTENELVIQSAIAGIKAEDLDISMEGGVVTIRGTREKPFHEEGDYFTQECYWGPFSREIILPVDVNPNRAEALMKEGVLTIRIPKILRERKRKISVKKLTD